MPVDQSVIEREMCDKACDFRKFQKRYYLNQATDEEATQYTTQAYWQSMRLSRDRLNSKGLVMDQDIKDDWKILYTGQGVTGDLAAAARGQSGEVFCKKEGNLVTGTSRRNVVTNRIFYRNGIPIYKKKDFEVCETNLIRGQVEDEEAVCPNCGHAGKISSYIDGCDYCGSKFSVNDFETRVSGFSLGENAAKKTRRAAGAITLGFMAAAAFTTFMFLTALIIAIAGQITGASLYVQGTSAVISMLSMQAIPALASAVKLSVVVIIVLGIAAAVIQTRRADNSSLVKSVIRDFSAYDFIQNMEYKLKNIHLAEEASQVNVFARQELGSVIEKYKEVIDCSLAGVKFCSAADENDRYVIDVATTIRLTLYDGRKISKKYERVKLKVSGIHSMVHTNTCAVRAYICPNCAATVSLLNGGVCEYCGTALDYEKYSWIIDSYESEKHVPDRYRVLKLAMAGIYCVVMIITAAIFLKDNTGMLAEYKEGIGYLDEVRTINDSLMEFDELYPNAEETHYEDAYLQRLYTYSFSDLTGLNAAYIYRDYLKIMGYTLTQEGGDTRLVMKKEVQLSGRTAHHCVEINYGEGFLELYLYMED